MLWLRALSTKHNRDSSAQVTILSFVEVVGVYFSRPFAVASYSDEFSLEDGRTTASACKQSGTC